MNILAEAVSNLEKGKGTIANFLDQLIVDAFYQKASDIHIEPKETGRLLIRYRIDGVLHDMVTLSQEFEDSLLFIIKVGAKLRTDEHFAPQDGKIAFKFDPVQTDVEKAEPKKDTKETESSKQYKVDARISILPVTHGEKVVIRLLSQENKAFALADLGFVDTDIRKIEKSYSKQYGMILATGPTGSGKTTSLYTIIKLLNTREKNITTIEDPVEYDIEGVNHIQINPKANLTFASGLRSILRQDPDIMMVGEIRDKETARIAVNSAMTGHLVLSTLHTNDAITTIPRLLDMGIEPFLISSTLNVIISQRLARKLCESCKKKYSLTKTEHDAINKVRPDLADHLKVDETYYKEVGCETCRFTGYKGRIGIYEVLEINKEIRDEIGPIINQDKILTVARKQEFRLLIEDGIEKLNKGIISVAELAKVVALKE